MSLIALNGWAQPHDGLAPLLPPHAVHVPYTDYGSLEGLWPQLAAQEPSLMVGWSLGGQLAVRAVLQGVVRPRALVLLATPFRFVASPEIPSGMGVGTYGLFVDNYRRQPERTARRFAALVAQGDAHAERIIAAQAPLLPVMADNARWLYWLEQLEHWQPDAAALATLPPTLVVHGARDGIVAHAQAQHWLQHVPHAQELVLPEAGHAPHAHDEHTVRRAIASWAQQHAPEVAHGFVV